MLLWSKPWALHLSPTKFVYKEGISSDFCNHVSRLSINGHQLEVVPQLPFLASCQCFPMCYSHSLGYHIPSSPALPGPWSSAQIRGVRNHTSAFSPIRPSPFFKKKLKDVNDSSDCHGQEVRFFLCLFYHIEQDNTSLKIGDNTFLRF